MRNINSEKQKEILKQIYITAEDIYNVCPVGMTQSRHIFNQIVDRCKKLGIPLFNTRPMVVPTVMLLEMYPQLKRR